GSIMGTGRRSGKRSGLLPCVSGCIDRSGEQPRRAVVRRGFFVLVTGGCDGASVEFGGELRGPAAAGRPFCSMSPGLRFATASSFTYAKRPPGHGGARLRKGGGVASLAVFLLRRLERRVGALQS